MSNDKQMYRILTPKGYVAWRSTSMEQRDVTPNFTLDSEKNHASAFDANMVECVKDEFAKKGWDVSQFKKKAIIGLTCCKCRHLFNKDEEYYEAHGNAYCEACVIEASVSNEDLEQSTLTSYYLGEEMVGTDEDEDEVIEALVDNGIVEKKKAVGEQDEDEDEKKEEN